MKVKAWFLLSRVPFLSTSILPFSAGTLLAWKLNASFSPAVFFLSLLALILIQLATHYNAEVYDAQEDALSVKMEKNFFSGGSQVLVNKELAPESAKAAGYALTAAALVIGLVLQFHYHSGKWTLLLGISGILCGFFYSQPPLRWVNRGIGEILIGYSFGLLPVAAGFYLQTQAFHPYIIFLSVPLVLSVMNVILINEFPDYPADKLAGKTNIVVRLGKQKAVFLYVAFSFLSVIAFLSSAIYMRCYLAVLFYLPALLLSLRTSSDMLKRKDKQPGLLEKMCFYTILINTATALSFIAGLLFF